MNEYESGDEIQKERERDMQLQKCTYMNMSGTATSSASLEGTKAKG